MTLRRMVLVASLAVGGCEAAHSRSHAVRRSLDAQASFEIPAELGERSRRARVALAGWTDDRAVDVALAVAEAEREIVLAATTGADDLRFLRAVEAFYVATELIAASANGMDPDEHATACSLLASSRNGALASRTGEPSAVSPAHSLRTLRKHQSASTHYEY